MIVVDASAVIAALLSAGHARRALATESLHAPHLIDSEVTQTLRRLVLSGRMSNREGWAALEVVQALGLHRYPATGLLSRIWELRNNVTAYDATYVALAETLDCSLLTSDVRLSQSTGLLCTVTVVPA